MVLGDYAIVLDGELGPDLFPAFDPCPVEIVDGCTIVHGLDIDQATLHSLLDRAIDLGLVLRELRLESDPS